MTNPSDDPQFFSVIGAPKAGTTSLYSYLQQHPQVCVSKPKEPAFFGREIFSRGKDHFETAYFPHYHSEKAFGEASTHNIILPYVPERIFDLYPGAKIIVSLRDPVDRAYSNWWMYYSNMKNFEQKTFAEAVRSELKVIRENPRLDDDEYWKKYVHIEHNDQKKRRKLDRSYIRRGYYATHIRRYLNYADRSQLKVIVFEDFIENPSSTMKEIFSFLDIDPDVTFQDHTARHRSYRSRFLRSALQLASALQIKRVLPDQFIKQGRKQIKPWLAAMGSKPEMSQEIRNRLYNHYQEEVRALNDMIDRDVSRWLDRR